jgi:hypothetical protein
MEDTSKREGERNWLSFEDAQRDLPSGTTIRWISQEAKRCGVWHRYGKKAVILKEGYPYFLKGEVWRESAARMSRSASGGRAKSSTPQSRSPLKKKAKSSTDELSEVRERLIAGKRRSSPQE